MRPDSLTETLALYKSLTYLLTYVCLCVGNFNVKYIGKKV